jgi:MFS family permease
VVQERRRSIFKPNLKALSSTVVRLGLVSFFADVSSEMLYPITPIFLTTTLGASMISVGLIEGVAESIASLLKTYAGAYSDRTRRRRPFIVVGYLFAAVAKPIIGFATSWPLVLVARGLDRTGKGIRTAPRDALLSDSVGLDAQGEAFGWHRLMDTLGAALGPLIAILFLSQSPENLRPLFMWAIIPGLASVVIAMSVRESSLKSETKTKAVSRWKWREASPGFKTYLLAWSVFSLSNSSDVFLILKAKSMGISLKTTILMYCFYNLIYALSSPYFGRLSDRIQRRYILISGLFVFAIVYFGFAFATVGWHFWSLFSIYALYMACTDGVGKALVVDLVPPEFKGTAIGMLGTVTGVGILGASSVAGLLWERMGSGAPFLYGAAGALISISILMFMPSKQI